MSIVQFLFLYGKLFYQMQYTPNMYEITYGKKYSVF